MTAARGEHHYAWRGHALPEPYPAYRRLRRAPHDSAVHLQLDCWRFPCPRLAPRVAIAAANTVFAGFTAADFWGGFFGMVFDMAFTWAVNGVCNLLGSALGKLLSKGLSGLTSAIFKD